jgi:hypothetical protein
MARRQPEGKSIKTAQAVGLLLSMFNRIHNIGVHRVPERGLRSRLFFKGGN